MSAKEYLQSGYWIARGVLLKRERINKLRQLAGSPGTSGRGERVSFSPQRSRLENCIAQIDEWEREIDADLRELNEYKSFIYNTKNNKHRDLLILHYIDGYTWEEASARVGYSERHARRIHEKAMLELSKICP